MTDNITVLNIQRQTLNGPNNTTFTVTFINTDKGAFTAYDNTPGIQLATENSKLTVHYRINVKNGKTYKNLTAIQKAQEVESKTISERILETLQNIEELLLHFSTSSNVGNSNDNVSSVNEEHLPF
jgi:ABC-type tungstate transport system permease subunit